MPPRKCQWRGCKLRATVSTPAGNYCPFHAAQIGGNSIDSTEAALDVIFGLPAVNKLFQKLAKPLDQLGKVIERAAPIIDRAARPQAPRPQPPPPPRTPPKDPSKEARELFGFTPEVKLTREVIKKRYHELVHIYHPDKGGSTAQMAKITAARDVLLASIR